MAEQAGSGIGRYRLTRPLGTGGMGSVWLADDTTLGRQVALKAIEAMHGLSEEERSGRIIRARLEAEHAARLSHHPHVASVLDIIEHDGLPWIVMEYVPGATDLGAVIQGSGPLSDADVARIGSAVLSALSAGHQVGIIHRDVKPANILLAPDQAGRPYGRVSLTDYGISLHTDSPRLTQGVIGTPGYLAPERIRGADPSPASDLFALGVTLYVASQGEMPFPSTEGPAAFVAPLLETPRPPVRAGAALTSVLMGLLEKDPGLRLTAEQSEQVLADVAAGQPSAASAERGRPTVQDTPGHAQPTVTAAGPSAKVPSTPQPSVQVPSAPQFAPTPQRPAQPPALPGFAPALPPSEQEQAPTSAPRPRPLRRPLTVALATLTSLGLIITAAVLLPRIGAKGSGDSDRQSPGSGSGSGSASGADDSTAGNTIVTIGVDAPLTDGLSSHGLGIKNSADLAVKQANQDHFVDGVTFKLKPFDDQSRPDTGRQNATELIADKNVLGVVGPLNSTVAQSILPSLDEAQLAVVSPAASNPQLTLGDGWQTNGQTRPFTSFFRTSPTDSLNGQIAAQYLYRDKGRKKAYVIDDKASYGVSIASAFKDEFTRLGGQVVGTDHLDPNELEFASLADNASASGADVVYYGGEYPAGGPLCAQLKEAGAAGLFAGGDGIYTPDFITAAQQAAEGAHATWVADFRDLPSGQAFEQKYEAADYQDPSGSYGVYAYDATWAIVQAVKATVDANDGKLPQDARPKIVAALQRVSFDGVTGRVAFDTYGDAVSRRLGVYTVKNGEWELAKRVSYTN